MSDFTHFDCPEILAPAGGREQFFAALASGADAVYLGLKSFNARARADNFSIEDLTELVPLARKNHMKVLLTLNILLKEVEIPQIITLLSQVSWIGIEALIVQDLGLARLVKRHFPHFRLHASTQMAIHNAAGVRSCAALGFRRVVLARELTQLEIKRIHKECQDLDIELEAFCHGSLCYSYSGLCFFSGANDARSGNRGECAYTCRKPYKILNEPGHGFLFSMKDLNTTKDLHKLVEAGVHTLKIEGRKKDAQYVTSSVALYRKRLDELFGRDTSPRKLNQALRDRDVTNDLNFSYHRESTSLFLNGRYQENVIDLDNPTHKGALLGSISHIRDSNVTLVTSHPLERFDGLRIEPESRAFHALPQHGSTLQSHIQSASERYENKSWQGSLRDFYVNGAQASTADASDKITINIPASDLTKHQIKVGALVYKTRSNELKRHAQQMSLPPVDARLRPLHTLEVQLSIQGDGSKFLVAEGFLGNQAIAQAQIEIDPRESQDSQSLATQLSKLFAVMGDAKVEASPLVIGSTTGFYVPPKSLKQLKRDFSAKLVDAMTTTTLAMTMRALHDHQNPRRSNEYRPRTMQKLTLKIDRLDYLYWILERPDWILGIREIVFEPKRAFLPKVKPEELMATLAKICTECGWDLRLAIPTVLRAWDLPLLKPWINLMLDTKDPRFEVGNLGAIALVKSMQDEHSNQISHLDLSADFSLFVLNSQAARMLENLGITSACLSIEDDAQNLQDVLHNWPDAIEPVVILYKDTPLFIAESCSLTALHNGCPGAHVCGYRTLHIEDEQGERYYVAHESCKSIVYGEKAFSLMKHTKKLLEFGFTRFRADFLTRVYTKEDFAAIIGQIFANPNVKQTHSGNLTHDANFSRSLL